MNIRFTLVAEGSTDAALLPILRWAVRCDQRVREIESQFAAPSSLPRAREGLTAKIRRAQELYPADLLFVHRDTDRESVEIRQTEIRNAVDAYNRGLVAVPVVPMRMTEAWLLIDEGAIRSAAGNPRGSIALDSIPKISAIERIADPKAVLYDTLRTACGLRGRRLAKFNPQSASCLVAERIFDLTPLRRLGAFVEFESALRGALNHLALAGGH